jgi:hypothetical protein
MVLAMTFTKRRADTQVSTLYFNFAKITNNHLLRENTTCIRYLILHKP